jgi:hypothetical protein
MDWPLEAAFEMRAESMVLEEEDIVKGVLCRRGSKFCGRLCSEAGT